MVASFFNCVEPTFGSGLDLTKIEENDDVMTMTNDSGFYKNSEQSLSLNIRDNSSNSKMLSHGSASTTLNTTAATNTPVTNVASACSPDNNCFGTFSLESPEPGSTGAGSLSASSGAGQAAQQQENYTTATQSSFTAKSGKSYNSRMRARASHTHTLSTPTAMSDFIAMLDAQSAFQEQFDINSNSTSDLSPSNDFPLSNRKERDSSSPLQNNSSSSSQFIDPNLLKSNLFVDTFTQSNDDEFYDESTNFGSLLDEYVSTDLSMNDDLGDRNKYTEKMAHMHSGHVDGTRRYSDVITNPVPEISNNRNSISHSIDFWNIPDRRNTINGALLDSTASKSTKNSFNMDNELTQVLNDYNMNFTQTGKRETHVSNPAVLSQRHGIKKQQRSSMSVLDGSLNNELFSKLYKNGAHPTNLKVVSWENPILSDEEDEFGFKNFDPIMPSLRPIASPKSPKSISSSLKSKNQKFITPSMMLSDSASTAAKVATTGSEKMDPTPQLEKRKYDLSINNPLKLSKSPPPHYHTIMPSPLASSTASSRRRRSTPNIMTIHSNTSINSVPNNSSVANCRGKSRSITPISTADDDAKPFKCKECSKAFRRSEHLKRHIRSVHSTERPFACMFCDKKFSRSDNLSQHLKTHKKHGDF